MIWNQHEIGKSSRHGSTHVTNGQSSEHRGGGQDTLGGTRSVQVAPRDEEGLDAGEDESGVVTAHKRGRLVSWHLGKTDGSGDGEERDDRDNGPSHLDLVGDEDGEE